MLYVRDFKPFGVLDLEGILKNARAEIGKLNNQINVDISETETQYQLLANLPGVAKENVDITMKNGLLTIVIKQEEEKNEEGTTVLLRERRAFTSSRTLNFGEKASNEIKAKLENGVLSLVIDKLNPDDGVKKISLD